MRSHRVVPLLRPCVLARPPRNPSVRLSALPSVRLSVRPSARPSAVHHTQLDVDLRKHVIEEVRTLNKRIDDVLRAASAATAAGTTTALELHIQKLVGDMGRLEQKAEAGMGEINAMITAEKVDARCAFSTMKNDIKAEIMVLDELKAARPRLEVTGGPKQTVKRRR